MYQAAENRYDNTEYKCSDRSGALLPRVSLGLWQNLGLEESPEEQEAVFFRAFDMGIVRFDLANNYEFPAVGRAERNFGPVLRSGLGRYKDELFIPAKTGFDFRPGPYGNWGPREYLIASLDPSLKRVGLGYVDVFYHHRPDLEMPLEETMGALSDIVRQRKALYVGISNYRAEEAEAAIRILREDKTPYLLRQSRYSMLERWVEDGPLELLDREGVGCICYSPLTQGALTGRYLNRIPEGFEVPKEGPTVDGRYLTEDKLVKIRILDKVAGERGQSPTRAALAWALHRKGVTSVLIGVSSIVQLEDNVKVLDNLAFGREGLAEIGGILKG